MRRSKQAFASLARLPGVVCDSRLSVAKHSSLPTKWSFSEKLCTPDSLGTWLQTVRKQVFEECCCVRKPPVPGERNFGHGLFRNVLLLHESRRYVCRFCTSHLGRVKKKLLHRLQTKQKNKTPTHKTKNTPKHKKPAGGSNLLRNSCDHGSRMRKGETGATN